MDEYKVGRRTYQNTVRVSLGSGLARELVDPRHRLLLLLENLGSLPGFALDSLSRGRFAGRRKDKKKNRWRKKKKKQVRDRPPRGWKRKATGKGNDDEEKAK